MLTQVPPTLKVLFEGEGPKPLTSAAFIHFIRPSLDFKGNKVKSMIKTHSYNLRNFTKARKYPNWLIEYRI